MIDYYHINKTLRAMETTANEAIESENDLQRLKLLKANFLGKKSIIAETLRSIAKADRVTKTKVGNLVNEIKSALLTRINEKVLLIEQAEFTKQLKLNQFDETWPGLNFPLGHQNPLFLVNQTIIEIFQELGYQIISGNEVETEEYNFNRLNLAENHPARAMQDTFYLESNQDDPKNRWLLRTHCTNVTARILSEQTGEIEAPLAFLSLGNVYRKDDDDATHSHQFSQIDAVLIGHKISFANLKWTLEYFCQRLFGKETKIRLRPSYFPFTEPSVEVDVTCPLCQGKGCPVCKATGFLEILGAGMIHPHVFTACGHNPNQVSGFAFGAGLERIAMIKYRINDIRLFYQNDWRFLKQF